MEIKRRKTRPLKIGNVPVGGDAPVSIQSMANTHTADVSATISQIIRLEEAGCEIVRVAVPDEESALAIAEIKKAIKIPLIADIHFDWKLALKSLDSGADALRLNPGNIGSAIRIREVVKAASSKGVPIRIGVNAGSLEKDLLEKHGHPTAEAMAESALRHIRILEDEGFDAIKVSLKASSVLKTVAAYRLLAEKVDYPFHVGITEAGTLFSGTIKSSVGLGVLFSEGLGDTLRVSLTADPVEEVKVGWEILKSLGLRSRGVSVVSCPTCGRIKINCEKLALEVETRLSHIKEPITIAVMGCVVNGPGEAMEADAGIAGGDGVVLLYSGGKVLRKVREDDAADALIEEVERIVKAGKAVLKP
ncbi:MAG: flavodoxin-dependent (E)-4-hydroxy-3-methylbut-2-enyl-diphosphate synthase [Thermodesulfobacteriota bacterium]